MNSSTEKLSRREFAASSARTCKTLAGVLVGTAVGDSLGLPMEGLSARRQKKVFSPPLRQRLVGSYGMISDDTEHTLFVAQALLEFPDDPAAFQRSLARRLRWWLASLPAGVGFATLRAILKLWFGVSPVRSGVMSAGNGPAMRSALLGVYFAGDSAQRRAFVQASTEITHRDPRAMIAALAVAETAGWMVDQRGDVDGLIETLAGLSESSEWRSLVTDLSGALLAGRSVAAFADQIGAGNGVSGYAFRSVPVAIYVAVRHRADFSSAITDVIACGGDTDTTAAITGALAGARVGVEGIPASWYERIAEFPRSVTLLRHVAEQLGRQCEAKSALGPVRYFWPAVPLRNLAFLAGVLAHGFRRLLPPY